MEANNFGGEHWGEHSGVEHRCELMECEPVGFGVEIVELGALLVGEQGEIVENVVFGQG